MTLRFNLREQIVQEIGRQIVQGRLRPGDTLPQEYLLCQQYQVSRTVIREALKGLSTRGLVKARPRTGTQVCARKDWQMLDPDVLIWYFEGKPQGEFLRHLTEIRAMIEPAAAELAAQRATPEEIARIEKCFQRLEKSIAIPGQWIEADIEFHVSILNACHNILLQSLVNTLRKTLLKSKALSVPQPAQIAGQDLTSGIELGIDRSVYYHRQIFGAIRDRDGAAASRHMQALLQDVAVAVETLISLGEG